MEVPITPTNRIPINQMSKSTDERSTPDILFNQLHEEFRFQIDLAATPQNAKLPQFYSKEDSAFRHAWDGRGFCNPPYSELYAWVGYADKQSGLTVMVLPCDTSTRWFHDFIWDGVMHCCRPKWNIRFPKGRFRFGKYTTSPQFATIIGIHNERFLA